MSLPSKEQRAPAAILAVAIADAGLIVVAASGHGSTLTRLDVIVNLALIALGLVLYAGASRRILRRPQADHRVGLLAGTGIAAIFAVDLTARYFASLPDWLGAIATAVLVLAALAVASRAGFLVVHRGAPIRDGAGCAVAAMLLGVAVLVGLGFAAELAFPARVTATLRPDNLTLVPRADRAFTATVQDAVTHLIEAPILALAAGTAAALLARASLRRSRRAARLARRAD